MDMCGKSDWTEAALPGAFSCGLCVQGAALPPATQHKVKHNWSWASNRRFAVDLSAAGSKADRVTLVVAHKHSDRVQADVPQTEANSVNHITSRGSFTTRFSLDWIGFTSSNFPSLHATTSLHHFSSFLSHIFCLICLTFCYRTFPSPQTFIPSPSPSILLSTM